MDKQNFDLSKLSDKEISELRKALLDESSKRGYKLKSNARVYGKLLDIGYEDELIKEGTNTYSNFEASNVVGYLEKAIYKICDVTLGNYEIVERNKHGALPSKHLVCNGAKLYDAHYDNYLEMTSEILDICKKYFEKRNVNAGGNNESN